MMCNNNKITPFWENSLSELTTDEWEKLCDGCGRCCLHKFQDEDTDELLFTRVACRLFDSDSCRCTSYDARFDQVADCVDIQGFSKEQYAWLPKTCSYRLRYENKTLPTWHPLLTHSVESVLKAEISMSGAVIIESDDVLTDLESYIDESLSL